MAKQTILRIGCSGLFLPGETREIKYLSDETVLGADIVFIETGIAMSEITVRYGQGKRISKDSANTLADYLVNRTTELLKFIDNGGNLVLICSTPVKMKLRVYSGGYDRHEEITIKTLIPSQEINGKSILGKDVSLIGNAGHKDAFKIFEKHLSHCYSFESADFVKLMAIKNTDECVSLKHNVGNGNMLVIPPLEISDVTDETNEKIIKAYKAFIFDNIGGSQDSTPTPDWINEILLPSEKEITKGLKELEKQKEVLNKEINTQKNKQCILDKAKGVLYQTGIELETTVEHLLCEMGFKIQEGEAFRADCTFKTGETAFVSEIKGVKGAARQKFVVQLEMWAMEYMQNNNYAKAKPVLIVNGFNTTPLKERTEQMFPKIVVELAKNKNHCLMTGHDLLNLYAGFLKSEITVKEVGEAINNTVGVFTYKKSWLK